MPPERICQIVRLQVPLCTAARSIRRTAASGQKLRIDAPDEFAACPLCLR
jgi:hypothetical protein